ncbi:hypothetical protein MXB_3475 [Myxobolus squamalis]|nr:hypothetical protein MXB_3475 [Myxobolus squamalis]
MTSIFYDQIKSNVEGTVIRFPNHLIRLLKSIGEGTYSYVYVGIDVENMKKYAIKQVSNHNERYESVTMNEIRALKRLKSKSYIIEIFDEVKIEKIHYILLEYCPLSLLDYIQKRSKLPFEDAEVIKLLGQITKAVDHMHSLDPPLINRDLKIDNILLSENCLVRLCDFGSATVEKIDTAALNYNQKCTAEKNLEQSTTNVYRAPEMLDFFLNYVIDDKADIWALGCIYYFVCYFCYPFENGTKLAILNLKYDLMKPASEFVKSIAQVRIFFKQFKYLH